MTTEGDNTAQQELEQTRLAYYQAVQLSRLKGTFLARTSHELRSPLSSLMGLHQLILADLCDSPEEEREFVRQANEAAQRLIALLDEIVYVAKLEAGRHHLTLKVVDLGYVLAEVQHLTHLIAANRGYPLEIATPDDAIAISGDEKHLIQTLVSFIDTAIAQMQEGSLLLTCAVEAHTVILTLRINSALPIWSMAELEEIDLTPPVPPSNPQIEVNTSRSPAFVFMVGRAVLEQMGGTVTLTASPTPEAAFTELQFVLPRVAMPA